MNELEKQIKDAAMISGRYLEKDLLPTYCFKDGANFILKKKLASKFVRWINDNFEDYGDCYVLSSNRFLENGKIDNTVPEGINVGKKYSAEELEDYWINNVYGK